MKKILCLLTATALLAVAGCSSGIEFPIDENIGATQTQETAQETAQETEQPENSSQEESGEQAQAQMSVSTVALEYPEKDYLENLNLERAVSFSDGDEIMITQSGTYLFSGDYTQSTITVNVDKDADDGEVYLVLDNANITSETGTPINIIEAKDAIIVLNEGTQNTIIQGAISTTDEDFPSGAIYSAADTVITGSGSLTVKTEYNDGINSRDDLVIENTNVTVNAVADGILGKDLLAIAGSTITVDAGKDGLKSSNDEDADRGNVVIKSGEFSITAANDGISAENSLQIDGGEFEITSGGGFVEVLNEITRGEGSGGTIQPSSMLEESMKGLKALNMLIAGGEFNISSYEDCVHADNNLTINGGVLNLISGDDAIHGEVDTVINDIELVVQNAYEGIEGATVTINGGNIEVSVLDDAINASSDEGFVKISDGYIYLQASGDGIDSNGDLIIEGGEIVINVDAIYSGGDSELDVGGVYTISGGTVVDENGEPIEATGFGGDMQPGGGGMRPGGDRVMPEDFGGRGNGQGIGEPTEM